MKKYFVFTLLLFIPMFSAMSVFSQYYNPPDVFGYSIILYDDNEPQLVSGIAGTELYFFYELYPWEDYDPWINSALYRTDDPENVYSEGTIIGYRDIIPAAGQHPIFFAQSGYTYCVFSDHRYIFYEWINYPYTPRIWVNSLIRVGYTLDCHTFPFLPTPTPTPTPTPPTCDPSGNGFLPPCPTPTPSPTATIMPIDVVEKYGTKEVKVSVFNNASGTTRFSIRTTNGTGNATFANNSTEVIVNGNTTDLPLRIKGITESSQADNIKIEAKLNNSSTVSAQDDFTVAIITLLVFEKFEPDYTELDNNPGNGQPGSGIGQRIFPDKLTLMPADIKDRSLVKVKATVSPAVPNVTVYFGSYDLDDPSTDATPIDTTGANGNDNNGAVNGSKSGDFTVPTGINCTNPPTGPVPGKIGCAIASDGTATAVFKTTMQPGDNFAIAVSFSDTYRDEIRVAQASGTQLLNMEGNVIHLSGEVNEDQNAGIRTKMLTVWRKLHLEVDSMGQARENYVRGNVSGKYSIGRFRSATINVTAPDLELNRFENGRLVLAFITNFMDVISNTANTVTVKNLSDQDITLTNNVNFEINSSDFIRSAVGTIPIGQTIAPDQTVILTISGTPLDVNAFSNGQMFITPVLNSLTVTGNTANSVNVMSGGTEPIVIADATHFRLYDDDDYNRNDFAETLDGDENEPIVRLPDSFRHLSDNLTGGILADGTPMNILASAYILPEYNWAENVRQYNQSNVNFNTNVEMNELLGLQNIQRGSRNDEKNEFWIAYFIIAYQGYEAADFDGRIMGMLEQTLEGITGVIGAACDCYNSTACPRPVSACVTYPIGGNTSLVYEESTQDIDKFLSSLPPPANFSIKDTEIVAPHELGHQFGVFGDQPGSLFGIMDYPNNNMSLASRVQFHPEHINILRQRVKSPGQ